MLYVMKSAITLRKCHVRYEISLEKENISSSQNQKRN